MTKYLELAMNLTTHKIRRELATLKPSTAHARDFKNNAIFHLLSYERSLSSKGEINLNALYSVCEYLAWLSKHIREIDDKRVLPSQRLFLADAFAFCVKTYENHKSV